MREEDVWQRCRALLADLDVSAPFDPVAFAAVLSSRRGRPVRLDSFTPVEGLDGAWLVTDLADYVFCAASLTGVHRDVVLAHELAHVAFDHGTGEVMSPEMVELFTPLLGGAAFDRMRARRGSYSTREEREAEVLGTLLVQGDPVTRRAPEPAEGAGDEAARLAAAFAPRTRR